MGTHDPLHPPCRRQFLLYATSLGDEPREQLAEAENSERDFHGLGSAAESSVCGAAGDQFDGQCVVFLVGGEGRFVFDSDPFMLGGFLVHCDL